MTVKGYYPSMSLGFEILVSGINTISGVALFAVGLVLLTNKIAIINGFIWLGLLCIPASILVITSGVFALLGSCKESVRSLKVALVLSICSIVMAGAVAGYAFSSSSDLPKKLRAQFYRMDDVKKTMIQDNYGCCGFSSPTEAVGDCKPEITCEEPITLDMTGKLKTIVIVAGIAAAVQLPALLCGYCVKNKMRNQQEWKMRKNKISLAEEAKGGYNKEDNHKRIRNKYHKKHSKK